MRVVIAGGHGKIALLLERALTEDGDEAVGLVRNPDHVADVEAAGAEAVVHTPATIGRTFDLVAGGTPVAEALAAL